MKFVDNIFLKRKTRPMLVLPRETGVHYLRGAVDTLGLEPGGWVGVLLLAIQPI
jgi:hypothetical protein